MKLYQFDKTRHPDGCLDIINIPCQLDYARSTWAEQPVVAMA